MVEQQLMVDKEKAVRNDFPQAPAVYMQLLAYVCKVEPESDSFPLFEERLELPAAEHVIEVTPQALQNIR